MAVMFACLAHCLPERIVNTAFSKKNALVLVAAMYTISSAQLSFFSNLLKLITSILFKWASSMSWCGAHLNWLIFEAGDSRTTTFSMILPVESRNYTFSGCHWRDVTQLQEVTCGKAWNVSPVGITNIGTKVISARSFSSENPTHSKFL